MHRTAMLLMLTACVGGADVATVQPQAVVCAAEVREVLGTDGSYPVEPGVDLLVRFTHPVDEDWSLEVVGATSEVALGADRLAAVLAPDKPLIADSIYTLSATLCGRTTEIDVMTGPEPQRSESVGASAFHVPLDEVVWMEPAGLASRLDEADTLDLALVVEAQPGHPRAEVGLVDVDGHEVERCGPFEPLEAVEDDGDTLTAHTDLARLGGAHRRLVVEALGLSAAHDLGDDLVEVRVVGHLDTRSLGEHGDDLCEAEADASRPCAPCQDGVEACVDIDGVLLRAERLHTDPRATADVCR